MTQADNAPALRMSLDLEPDGARQATLVDYDPALCIFCGMPGELVPVTWCETPPDADSRKAHGYCADMLGVRA